MALVPEAILEKLEPMPKVPTTLAQSGKRVKYGILLCSKVMA